MKRESLEAAHLALNLTITVSVLKGISAEMVKDGIIQSQDLSSDRTVLFLTSTGEKLLNDSGYTAIAEKELDIQNQIDEDEKIEREKTRLEIDNLKISKPLSIAALVISIISVISGHQQLPRRIRLCLC